MFDRIRSTALAFLAAVAGLTVGCGGKTAEITRVCPDFPGSPTSTRSFSFVLTREVRPENVPVPTNDSEAILFGLAYPTLIGADCEGHPIPYAATAWEGRPSDGSWAFTLDPRVTFADGSPLTPAAVKKMWMDRRKRAAVVAPWIWDRVEPSAVEVLSDGRLLVRAPNAYSDLLHALTQPSLALATDNVPPWPLGTRGTLAAPKDFSSSGVGHWTWTRGGGAAPGAARIEFRIMKDAAPRDVVAAGADAFFVRDGNALEYLESLDGYRVTPFPYSRLYVLLTPETGIAKRIKRDEIAELADQAVADARPASDAGGYRVEHAEERGGRRTSRDRIVIPWWDRDTLAIAEHLSALWKKASRAGVPAILPKKHTEFFQQVAEGKDAVYVFPVYPRLASESLQRLHLLRSAPWLAERGGAIPLFETRGHLVARKGLTGFDSGYDGLPRLESAGWIGEEPVP